MAYHSLSEDDDESKSDVEPTLSTAPVCHHVFVHAQTPQISRRVARGAWTLAAASGEKGGRNRQMRLHNPSASTSADPS